MLGQVTTNGTWNKVGGDGISDGIASYQSLALGNNGDLFVAYVDDANNNKATVLKWTNNSWTAIGGKAFTPASINRPSLAINNSNQPVLAYQSGGSILASSWDGSLWNTLGTTIDTAGGDYPNLILASGGTPYVAYIDYNKGSRITVKKWTGIAWQTLGNAGFSDTAFSTPPSLAFAPDGTLFMACVTNWPFKRLALYKYNGTSWNEVTISVASNGYHFHPVLKFAGDGTLYLGFIDGNAPNGRKATVYKFSANNWSVTGGAGINNYSTSWFDMDLDENDKPVIVYCEGSYTSFGAMRWDGMNWIDISPSYGSNQFYKTKYTQLVIDDNGTPYAAYQTQWYDSKTVVVKYLENIGVQELKNHHFTVYPNPTSGILHLTISGLTKSTPTWHVFNMQGQIIAKGRFNGTNENQTIDLSSLAPGVYQLQIKSGTNYRMKSIVRVPQ